jgi:hypothetical protein
MFQAENDDTVHMFQAENDDTVHLFQAENDDTVHLFQADSDHTVHMFQAENEDTVHLFQAVYFLSCPFLIKIWFVIWLLNYVVFHLNVVKVKCSARDLQPLSAGNEWGFAEGSRSVQKL